MSQGYIKHKVFIPADDIDIDKVRQYYTIPMYNEQACQKCPHYAERGCGECENCPCFSGHLELFSEKVINGQTFVLVPNGNLPRIKQKLGIDTSSYIDLRCREKFKHPLKWTGSLREGGIVDGIPVPNQKEIVTKWLQPEARFGFIQCPPRCGKTVMGNFISIRMGFRTLIIAHQVELLENFMKSLVRDTNLLELRQETGEEIASIIDSSKHLEKMKTLDIALCTYQTFIRDFSRIKQYITGNFGLVVVDEAHQAGAEAYAKFMSSLDARYKLGLSATPLRKDALNKALYNIIGPVTVKSESVGLIPTIEVLETGVKCTKSFSAWVYAMKFLQENEYRNKLIVSQVEQDLKSHKCIIIPVDTIAHLNTLVNMINEKLGIDTAVGYHSSCRNRDTLLKDIDAGKFKVVVAIKSMVKQGIDLLLPSMIYIQFPMSAQKQPVGAPFFYQLGNRVCTNYAGKREPIIKIFLDDLGESKGCLLGLWGKEIVPGLKPGTDGRPKYRVGQNTYEFFKQFCKEMRNKQYRQVSNQSYNPESGAERPRFAPVYNHEYKQGSLLSLLKDF